VQGVNFRYYTALKARELGLSGFVRNLPAGVVEVVAEGAEEPLSALAAWCRRGPSAAQVDTVEEESSQASGEFQSFEIR